MSSEIQDIEQLNFEDQGRAKRAWQSIEINRLTIGI